MPQSSTGERVKIFKPATLFLCMAVIAGPLVLAGCADDFSLAPEEPGAPGPGDFEANRRERIGSLVGPDGIVLLSSTNRGEEAADGTGLGVNSYLWRASLDTISFMPVNSADPFGGVILTDWYSPPATPGERIKVNVYVLDPALRADAVRVAVFRQVRDESGAWVDAAVNESTANQLEEAILTRARQLRTASLGG
ncbi:MAG: DUF3576 domain-containing protein [Azospirillaceae bacterium]